MSKENQNPEKALHALLIAESEVKLSNGKTVTVNPISISTMAMLDLIKSPLLYNDDLDKKSIYDLLPSFYICIKGYKECNKSENLYQDAMDYFDSLNIRIPELSKIKDAVFKELYLATELADETGETNKKK